MIKKEIQCLKKKTKKQKKKTTTTIKKFIHREKVNFWNIDLKYHDFNFKAFQD